MRGRDLGVQQRQAQRLNKRVLAGGSVRGDFGDTGAAGGRGGAGAEDGALVCAEGPRVGHESVSCYRHDGGGGGKSVASASWGLSDSYGARIARSLVPPLPPPTHAQRARTHTRRQVHEQAR